MRQGWRSGVLKAMLAAGWLAWAFPSLAVQAPTDAAENPDRRLSRPDESDLAPEPTDEPSEDTAAPAAPAAPPAPAPEDAAAVPPADAAAVPPAASDEQNPTGSATAPLPAPAVPGAPRRIIVLPVEFLVHERTAGYTTEAEPAWSERATTNLETAARDALAGRGNFEVVPLPSLDGPSRRALNEHRALVKAILRTAHQNAGGGREWADRVQHFDLSIGDGLAPLAEASGAAYLFVGGGSQVTRSSGSVLTQLAMLSIGALSWYGGGTHFEAAIVDLRSGEVQWCNTLNDSSWVGMGYLDARDPGEAAGLMTELFKDFPASRLRRNGVL